MHVLATCTCIYTPVCTDILVNIRRAYLLEIGSQWVLYVSCVCAGHLQVDVTVRIQTLSLSEAGCADVVVVAAAGGDLRTLTSYLSQHPDHVRLTSVRILAKQKRRGHHSNWGV